MFFKIVRAVLGKAILIGDALSRPRPKQRDEAAQKAVDKDVSKMALYQFHACPFCVKTRRTIRQLNLPIKLIDAKVEPHKSTLLEQGGSPKVPCLRIESDDGVQWMYESNDIITYLEQRFG